MADTNTFARDAAIFRVVSQHGFKPIVWDITPEQWAELRTSFARIFGWLADASASPDDARDEQRRQSDAAVLSAIRRQR
jgi:hypothetical protein